MEDSDLINFFKKGKAKEPKRSSTQTGTTHLPGSDAPKSVPEFRTTGILIRKTFTIRAEHPDGTFELISTNSWIDKAGLPQKEKKQAKEIPKTEMKVEESY